MGAARFDAPPLSTPDTSEEELQEHTTSKELRLPVQTGSSWNYLAACVCVCKRH